MYKQEASAGLDSTQRRGKQVTEKRVEEPSHSPVEAEASANTHLGLQRHVTPLFQTLVYKPGISTFISSATQFVTVS